MDQIQRYQMFFRFSKSQTTSTSGSPRSRTYKIWSVKNREQYHWQVKNIFLSILSIWQQILLHIGHNYKTFLCLRSIFFLGLSYSLSYATIPNVHDKLSVKISYPPINHQIPLGELPVFGSSSDNESQPL